MGKRKKQRIRALALAVIQRADRIFVAEGYDAHRDLSFFRPLGGGIEFGERGEQTIVRELMEEIGQPVVNVRYLAAVENIFVYEGQPGHEIVLLYRADFANPALYDPGYTCQGEDDGDLLFTASWQMMASFGPNRPLYPDGLLPLLTEAL